MVVNGVGGQFETTISLFYKSTGGFAYVASPFASPSILLFWFTVLSSSLLDFLRGWAGNFLGTIFDD